MMLKFAGVLHRDYHVTESALSKWRYMFTKMSGSVHNSIEKWDYLKSVDTSLLCAFVCIAAHSISCW